MPSEKESKYIAFKRKNINNLQRHYHRSNLPVSSSSVRSAWPLWSSSMFASSKLLKRSCLSGLFSAFRLSSIISCMYFCERTTCRQRKAVAQGTLVLAFRSSMASRALARRAVALIAHRGKTIPSIMSCETMLSASLKDILWPGGIFKSSSYEIVRPKPKSHQCMVR